MKIIRQIFKGLAIGLAAIVLVTAGIDAADHYDNFSESIIGRVVFGERAGPCPDDMAYVNKESGGFCIDKFEASPDNECPYSEISSQSDTRANLDYSQCRPVSRAGALPWRFISQSQAAAACAKAGKRLPTDEEWYLASLGTPDPEGNWTLADCQVSNNWEKQPGATGSGEKCVSSAGAYDMIGNAWEWVKGEISDGAIEGKKLPPQGFIKSVDISGLPLETDPDLADPNFNEDYLWVKESGVRGMARGGYWDNKAEAGLYAMYLVSPPAFAGTGVGFRCAK